LEAISENTIKKITLGFLKTYYKYRPRLGDTVAKLDQVAPGGIIADGHLSFPKEDGKQFVATFEATAHEVKEEVIYKTQESKLRWDAVAVAFLLGALLFSYAYYKNIFTLEQVGWLTLLSIITVTLCAIGGLFILLFRHISRYRYIYAIEQFKSYHADEQWISIGEDVLNDGRGRYLDELKKQCVLNGFGLLIIENDLEPHLVITPSREEVFGNKRSFANFISGEQLSNKLAQGKAQNWIKSFGKRFNLAKLGDTSRFAPKYYKQLALSMVGMLLMGAILIKEADNASMIHHDDNAPVIASNVHINSKPEPKDFELDSASVVQYHTKTKTEVPKAEDEFTERDIPTQKPPKKQKATPNEPSRNSRKVIVTTEESDFMGYDCSRFFNIRETVYSIKEGIYPTMKTALLQVKNLQNEGYEAGTLWLGCFDNDQEGYLVFVDLFHNDVNDAIRIIEDYNETSDHTFKLQKLKALAE